MDLYAPPEAGLWMPPKPGIIRPSRRIQTPAEARGIGHNGGPEWLGLIPGMTGAVASGARQGAALTTLSYITAAGTATGSTITCPATAQAGDLAVAFQISSSGSSVIPASVLFSGFANLISGTQVLGTAGYRMETSYKVLGSGDPGSTLTGINGGAGNYKGILIFRPDGPISAVTGVSGASEVTTGDPVLQTLSISGQSPVFLAFGSARASTSAPVTSGTLVSTGATVAPITDLGFAYRIFSVGDTVVDLTWDMTDLGTNGLQSIGMAIT